MKPLSYTEMKSTLLVYVKVKNIGKRIFFYAKGS